MAHLTSLIEIFSSPKSVSFPLPPGHRPTPQQEVLRSFAPVWEAYDKATGEAHVLTTHDGVDVDFGPRGAPNPYQFRGMGTLENTLRLLSVDCLIWPVQSAPLTRATRALAVAIDTFMGTKSKRRESDWCERVLQSVDKEERVFDIARVELFTTEPYDEWRAVVRRVSAEAPSPTIAARLLLGELASFKLMGQRFMSLSEVDKMALLDRVNAAIDILSPEDGGAP